MPDDTDSRRDRLVADDVGPVREWADEAGAVPVRTGRARGESTTLALVSAEEAGGDDHERLDWPAFGDVLDDTDRVVVYDGSGDPDGLSVDDADSVGADARYVTSSRPSYEERSVEGTEYEGHGMRGEGAPVAEAGEHRPDEGVRETRPDRGEPTAPALDMNDVGKTVVDEDGTELGVVAQASGEDGAVHIDVDPGVTERILSKLGWTGEEDVDYVVPPERIRRVTDDEVVLTSDGVDTTRE